MKRKIYPPPNRRQKISNWIILAAIALMCLATWYIVEKNYYSGSKSHDFSTGEQHAELQVFYRGSSKPMESTQVAAGEDLVFSMSSTFPAHIALVEIAADEKARIVFSSARIPPGKLHLIAIGDEQFVYTVAGNYPRKICLLAAQSESDLSLVLSRIGSGQEEKLASDCVSLDLKP